MTENNQWKKVSSLQVRLYDKENDKYIYGPSGDSVSPSWCIAMYDTMGFRKGTIDDNQFNLEISHD